MQWMPNSSKNPPFLFFYNLFCNLRSFKEEWKINLPGTACLTPLVPCGRSVSLLPGVEL